ncbi:hypothetical protein QYE76_063131 [Lolium multiflorum]|uniref:DUF8039 domain-containing protein n=1 Tax=Lolium multiflorum TaxID=4521 RepID=A0AAD8S5J6_LOLMU|nr:hypothetical protein QYE76_063131 [Lolium multiflorum]
MADAFRKYKQNLAHDFVKRGKTPDFKGQYEKLQHDWPEFVKQKKSEQFLEMSKKNKKNAAKKEYNHIMGPGGYRFWQPRWEKMENEPRARGIRPEKKQRGFHGGLTGWCTDDRNYCTGASVVEVTAPEPPRYPVDDIKEMKACHLYYPIGNMSMKVATGSALPGALHHNNPIPDGYARVTVEEIVQGFEDLDIDIATPEGRQDLEMSSASSF